jgi:hypothetical protein
MHRLFVPGSLKAQRNFHFPADRLRLVTLAIARKMLQHYCSIFSNSCCVNYVVNISFGRHAAPQQDVIPELIQWLDDQTSGL